MRNNTSKLFNACLLTVLLSLPTTAAMAQSEPTQPVSNGGNEMIALPERGTDNELQETFSVCTMVQHTRVTIKTTAKITKDDFQRRNSEDADQLYTEANNMIGAVNEAAQASVRFKTELQIEDSIYQHSMMHQISEMATESMRTRKVPPTSSGGNSNSLTVYFHVSGTEENPSECPTSQTKKERQHELLNYKIA